MKHGNEGPGLFQTAPGGMDRYRLSVENVVRSLQEHINHCQICRCTYRKCDEGQYLWKWLVVAQTTRTKEMFRPLDVS